MSSSYYLFGLAKLAFAVEIAWPRLNGYSDDPNKNRQNYYQA